MGDKYGKISAKYVSKKVINIKTKEVYPSAKYVSKKIGVNYATFKNWMSGRVKNKTNYKYL